VWISEQTAIISPYNIKWLDFITVTGCVYCAVRTVLIHNSRCLIKRRREFTARYELSLHILFVLTRVLYSSPQCTNYGRSETTMTEDGPFTVTWHLAKVSSRRHGRLRRMVSRTGTTRSVFNTVQWHLVASSWRVRSHDLGDSSTATTPQTRQPDLHS